MKDELSAINDLHLWDFEIASHENGRLLLLGSNDFTYSHYLEAEFSGVTYCNLPETFSHAEFRLGRREEGVDSIWVTAESMSSPSAQFQIRASDLTIRVGKVYYYERRSALTGEDTVVADTARVAGSNAASSAYLAIFLFVLAPIGAIVLITALLLFGVEPRLVFAPGRALRAGLEAGGWRVANRVVVAGSGVFWWALLAVAGLLWERLRSRFAG
jgi:hypothetical protein